MFYGTDPLFWLKFFILLVALGLILFSFDQIMSKLLKVEKRSWFSYEYTNDRHKKVDRIIRTVAIILIFITFIYRITGNPEEKVWFFDIWVVFIVSFIIREIVSAIMEMKYAENRKRPLLTISNLGFGLMLFCTVFLTDFLDFYLN